MVATGRPYTKRGYTTVGIQIHTGLMKKNMTAGQLAGMLGTTPEYLSRIIHGDRSGKKYLKRIQELLDIEIAA